MEGVKKAMVLPPNPNNTDIEKRDRRMAKAVIDTVGLEKEKYRLGYTKVRYVHKMDSAVAWSGLTNDGNKN